MLTNTALLKEISRCSVPPGSVRIWRLGQMGFACRLGAATLYFDLYLSPNKDRLVPPPFPPDQVRHADLVLGTHDHIDHIDRAGLPALLAASPGATLCVPDLLRGDLLEALSLPPERLLGLDDGLTVTWRDMEITGIAAAHEFLNRDPRTGRYPCLCYLVRGNGLTIFHAGDTLCYEGLLTKLQDFSAIDVLILPINGRDGKRYRAGTMGNMTFQEAADLAGALQPGLVIPGHYDMFAGNGERPEYFAQMLEAKYPGQRYWIGEVGQSILYPGV